MSILDRVGRTPLVELRNIAAGLKMPVLAKCEHLNPGGSVKDRIAVAIIQDAEQRGLLQWGATLIEATAGNTGTGLALVAAIRGYKFVCVMPVVLADPIGSVWAAWVHTGRPGTEGAYAVEGIGAMRAPAATRPHTHRLRAERVR